MGTKEDIKRRESLVFLMTEDGLSTGSISKIMHCQADTVYKSLRKMVGKYKAENDWDGDLDYRRIRNAGLCVRFVSLPNLD